MDQTSQQYTEVLCLYSLVFISNRRVFIAQSSYCLINSYPLSTNRLINSCFLLPLAQIPAETPLNIHDSPVPAGDQETVGRTFSAPPDRTGKVSCPPAPAPPAPQFPAFPITDLTKPVGD